MPLLSEAQQAGRVYRIGLVAVGPSALLMNPFWAAMREYGWIEGQNFTLEPRSTAGKTEHDRVALATELIEQKVDLILAINSASAQAAKRASTIVPIVMLMSGFPVEAGLAVSLARPGGNVTGLSIYAVAVIALVGDDLRQLRGRGRAACAASTCSAAAMAVSTRLVVSPTSAPCSVTATSAPLSRSTACSALCARCVRPSFIFVIFASGSVGFSQSSLSPLLPPSVEPRQGLARRRLDARLRPRAASGTPGSSRPCRAARCCASRRWLPASWRRSRGSRPLSSPAVDQALSTHVKTARWVSTSISRRVREIVE